MDIHELENKRLETKRQIDELTEIYLQQKEAQGPGVAKMMRRKMGYDKPRDQLRMNNNLGEEKDLDDYRSVSDDYDDERLSNESDEARPVRGKRGSKGRRSRSIKQREIKFGEADLDSERDDKRVSSRSKSRKKSKQIRFGEDELDFERDEKDTPPTRSRSRKARSRVAFNEPASRSVGGKPLKSALANPETATTPALQLGKRGASKGGKSRGSSKSRSAGFNRSVGHSSGGRNFSEPKHGIGGQGTDSRRDAFEAKFDKYRANRKTKEAIERRAKIGEQPDFDITTKNRRSPSKKARKYTTVVGAEIDFKPSGKHEKDDLMPEGYEEALLREALLDTRKDPFKVLGVSPEDKMAFFLLKWVFDSIKEDSDVDDEKLEG